MKTKKFKIVIESPKEFFADFKKTFHAIEKRGEKTLKNREGLVLSFESFATLLKILTPERVRLIQTVREMKPKSVSELAYTVK